MQYIAAPRQGGKTTLLVNWLKGGHAVAGYPGWSRILIVTTIEEALRLRREYLLHPKQVYALSEYQAAQHVLRQTEVGFDNVDHMLAYLIGAIPNIVSFTTYDEQAPTR